ncbi:MAG: ribosome-binding factor A [Candidatus Paceibacterota bacterium]|jgi:ribosome-binding factor A
MAFRNEKIKEEVHHLASEFLSRESNRDALITVTNTFLSDDNKYATILFTTLPENKEKAVLDFLKRKRGEFKEYVKNHSKIGRIPFFDFEIDEGQKSANLIYTIE